jgi:hypothetical protein
MIDVLTTVVMKNVISWDITPYSPFRRNISPPNSGYKNNPNKMAAWKQVGNAVLLGTCFHAGILFGLFFDPEEGGDMFLRNVC